MRRIRPSTAVAVGVTVAGLIAIVNANRGVAPFSSENIATWLVVGLSLGGIYAITASGLVVTYSTTGVFNFAHAAIGGFLAFCYWELRVNRAWPAPLALFVVILVLAPLIGIALDRFLMRRLRTAPLVVQLMVTVGLMLAVMGVTTTIWKPTEGRTLQHFYESSDGVQIGPVTATWHRIIIVVTALLLAVGLRLLLRHTRIGIAMRAVVDNRDLAGLAGVRPSVVSGTSWALGTMTAGLAGILIAPETGMVTESLALVIVVAFAAAAVGQLKHLPWAFVGGMVIGLAKAFSALFLSFGKDYGYATDAIPAVVLFIAVLFLPHAGLETGNIRVTKRTERLTTPLEAVGGGLAIFGVVVAWAYGWIPWISGTNLGERTDVWLGRGVNAMALGLIMLSLVPLIGWAGQVSFANFAIAGIGAVLYSHLGGGEGNAIGILWVVLICAPLGAAIALPALRLKGLYLALATMAFAEFTDKVIVRHPKMLATTATGRLFEPLHIFGFRMSSDAGDRRAFVVFLALMFAALFIMLELLRRTRWVRRWIAMSDSPAASATVGVNLTTTKIAVFALSGAMAGFAGTMLGLSTGALRQDSFPLLAGLPLVLLLAVNGVRFPTAAFLGITGLMSLTALSEVFGNPNYLTSIALIGPGLAAIGMAYRPEGTVFYSGRDLAPLLPWRNDARTEKARVDAERRRQDVTRDGLNDLGLTRAFSIEKVAQLDRVLRIQDEMLERPGLALTLDATAAVHPDEDRVNGAPVG
jgi:branched-chain amino acid transport system permease protein